jgi:hypothetical protein
LLKHHWFFRLGTFYADLEFFSGFRLSLLFPELVEKGVFEGFQGGDALTWHVVEKF